MPNVVTERFYVKMHGRNGLAHCTFIESNTLQNAKSMLDTYKRLNPKLEGEHITIEKVTTTTEVVWEEYMYA